MAEFIDFETDASDVSSDENDEMEVLSSTLIDDADDQQNNNPSFFRFLNQTRDPEQVLREAATEESFLAQNIEANNYVEYEDEESETDDFKNLQERRKNFLERLENPILEQTRENKFYSALLFAIKFSKTQNKHFCEEEQLKYLIGEELF